MVCLVAPRRREQHFVGVTVLQTDEDYSIQEAPDGLQKHQQQVPFRGSAEVLPLFGVNDPEIDVVAVRLVTLQSVDNLRFEGEPTSASEWSRACGMSTGMRNVHRHFSDPHLCPHSWSPEDLSAPDGPTFCAPGPFTIHSGEECKRGKVQEDPEMTSESDVLDEDND
ncbi:hypothetical protein Bbelb_267930 [Branchiostoma belcheri]|nr:hypothetical protein Bbelb_267930 [Branchiostoma belcheri]